MRKKMILSAFVTIAFIVLLILSLFSLAGETEGVETSSTMNVSIEYNSVSKNPVFLIVSGKIQESDAYLCITLYKKGFNKDKWWSEGEHKLDLVSRGSFEKRYAIKKDYDDGVYEVSLFNSKTPKSQCTVVQGGCYFCKLWGFHLKDLLLYKTGYVK